MYNEQIVSLITASLTDVELNEKEKQILLKNAESLGIDLVEFDVSNAFSLGGTRSNPN